mgnify:CR=1 FL=1
MISPEDFLVHSHPSEVLFEDQHVIVGWAGNPALSGEVDLDMLLELGHVATSIGAGAIPSFARQQMRLYRERLKIEATVPNFSAIPAMLIGSHRVSILQARLAREWLLASQRAAVDSTAWREYAERMRAWAQQFARSMAGRGETAGTPPNPPAPPSPPVPPAAPVPPPSTT